MPSYPILTKSKKIETIEDIAGLKLRGNGVGASNTLRALGAVPIQVASSEIYDSVSRGTVDGIFFPYIGLEPYSLEEVLGYSLDGLQLGAAGSHLTISERSWSALPEPVQRAMEAASAQVQADLCAWFDAQNDDLRRGFAEENGMEIVTVPPEEAAKWNAAVAPVLDQWAESMRNVGKDGAAVLAAFRGTEDVSN